MYMQGFVLNTSALKIINLSSFHQRIVDYIHARLCTKHVRAHKIINLRSFHGRMVFTIGVKALH